MKKLISIYLVLIMLLVSVPVFAHDFNQEEEFSFDIYDSIYREPTDEMRLMAVEEDVMAEFEERLIAAWENMDTEVQLYPDIKIHKDDITTYFATVFFENPKYYYVVRSFSGTVNGAGYMGKLTKLSYTITDKTEIEKTWAEIDNATEEILLYIDPEMTDFEKIMTVHDYMDLHYVYDLSDLDQTYLIMLDKRGVCAAYSEAFQHMMNVLGIEGTIVTGKAKMVSETGEEVEYDHMWNMVKIDNRWYHVDVTWDDPVPDQFGIVCHEYMFLSESAIENKGHYGFDAPYYAGSTTYNNAPWRDDGGSLVTIDGIMYRVEGNNLIDENSNVIYKNLDGGDGKWSIGSGYVFKNEVLTGLCEFDGSLYFNTDKGIYSYNPNTREIVLVLEKEGVCGVFADKNMLIYNAYDREIGEFVKDGELRLGDFKLAKPYFEEGKAVVRMYNDYDVPIWIISKGNGYMIRRIEAKSIGTAKFDNGTEQTIYIWKNSLEPLVNAISVSE